MESEAPYICKIFNTSTNDTVRYYCGKTRTDKKQLKFEEVFSISQHYI